MKTEKPEIVEIEVRCEGDISEEMEETINAIEKDMNVILLKYGYNGIEFNWEN